MALDGKYNGAIQLFCLEGNQNPSEDKQEQLRADFVY